MEDIRLVKTMAPEIPKVLFEDVWGTLLYPAVKVRGLWVAEPPAPV